MNESRQSGRPESQEPPRNQHVPLRLSECGDTLTIRQLCAVLQISDRTYRHLRQHGAFPIPELVGVPKRFSRTAVEAFLSGGGAGRLRKVS